MLCILKYSHFSPLNVLSPETCVVGSAVPPSLREMKQIKPCKFIVLIGMMDGRDSRFTLPTKTFKRLILTNFNRM